MRVVIIGSGNVATILGRLIKKNGHTILQVISKQIKHAEILATILNSNFTDNFYLIDTSADIYIVAISDDSIEEFVTKLNIGNKLIIHTAGAISKHVLAPASNSYGVLYPLQSLRKEIEDIINISFLIDGNTEETVNLIEKFALTISPLVTKADDEQRIKLHLAATVVNNFTNHLFSLTEKFCLNENVDFKLLLPLINETTRRLNFYSATELQTGPASRNDVSTLNKHAIHLEKYAKLKFLYEKISDSIRE